MSSGIKEKFQKLNGWQRIWFVLTLLVWVPGIIIAFGTAEFPLKGFSEVSNAKSALQNAQAAVSNLEVDCKLNEKKSDAEMERVRPRWQELNADLYELNAEKERINKSAYSWSAQSQTDIQKIDKAIAYVQQQRDALFNTPVLKLHDKCLTADSQLGYAQKNYDIAKSMQFDPVYQVLQHLFVATLVAAIFSAVLYALGFCVAWIVRGFKGK
jgi:hypothetical protein